MVSHCNKIQFFASIGNYFKIKLKVKKLKLEEHKFGMINCFRHALFFFCFSTTHFDFCDRDFKLKRAEMKAQRAN